jgi:arsenite-transporting ATPase
VHDLIELAPPGIDELFAILTVTDALLGSKYDLLVLDTAPTGHALRLLELPAAAHDWVRALLRVLVKYQGVLGLGPLAQDLVDLARGLRGLRALLADPKRARFVAVARAAALPVAETTRLCVALDRLGIALSAVLVNALTPPGCSRCQQAAAAEAAELDALARARPRPRAILVASAVMPPPRGVTALRRFGQSFALR